MNIWYFIPFLLVPILVHLFDFRKAKKFYFSSVKFIANLASKTRSKSKLKYLIILSNRLLIFLTVLGLLWVLINGQTKSTSMGAVGAYSDNSISSSVGNTTMIDEGLSALSQQYGTIVFFDNETKSLIEKESNYISQNTKSAESVKWDILLNRFNENDLSTLYLFSDFQQSDMTYLKSLLIDSAKRFHLLLTNDLNSKSNVVVDSLYILPNQENLSEVSVFVRLKHFNMNSGSVIIKLINGSRQLSSVVREIAELGEVRFDISKSLVGEFEIEINGDEVLFDNRFHFSIEERVKPKITILESQNSNVVKTVFDNKELFLVDVQEINTLDYDLLQESDLVVMSDRYEVPEVIQNLRELSFIVFPADSIEINSYEKLLGLGIELLNEVQTETSIDSENPLFRGVFDKYVGEQSMVVNGALFEFEGDFEPIIKYRGGNSFLLKSDNVYFFNTSLNESGGFKSNALFLPILFQIAFNSSDGLEIPYYFPGDLITLAVRASDIPVKLIRDQFEVIPSFNSTGSALILELPSDLPVGKYHLVQGDDTLRTVAINYPKSESIMQAPTIDEMQNAFADVEHVSVSKIINETDKVLFANGSQSSLWKYALILALFLILTETVLHRYLR